MKEFILKEYETFPYKNAVNEMPELIRCKDCKYKYTDGDNVVANYCLLNHNRVQPDEWFCADAEREEE